MDSNAVVTVENQHIYEIQSGSAAGADPRAGFRGGNDTGSRPIKRRKLVFSKRLVAQNGWKVPKDPTAAATKAKTEDDGRFCLLNQRLAAVEGALATVNTKIDSVGGIGWAIRRLRSSHCRRQSPHPRALGSIGRQPQEGPGGTRCHTPS